MDETISFATTPKYAQPYFSHLCQCMSLKDGVLYGKEHVFERQQLLSLTPKDICCYFNLKAFGTNHPTDDSTSKLGRSSSLMFYKKAISFFMPHKLMSWKIQSMTGNPTKSIEVNNLVKKVQKLEVRKQGKASQARRPLTLDEFRFVVHQLKKKDCVVKKYAIPALCAFQFHLIGRIDDTCQFMLSELGTHDVHPFALKARMCWSKNVMEECQAPSQIILGAHDPDFCTLLNVGLYLEEMYPTELNADGELNCFAISSSPSSSKARVSRILKEIFDSEEFKALFGNHHLSTSLDAWLGSHSLRKLVATHARRNGYSRDEIDLRGRWKKGKRTVDAYLDTTIPYPDAKVAASISIGGPIKYELVGNNGLDDNWICQNVTPTIFKLHHCKKVAVVFGKAILWACFDPSQKDHVPKLIRERVISQYESIRLLDPNTNPIQKVSLVIAGHEGQLFIDELNDPDEPASGDGTVQVSPADASKLN